MSDRGRTKERRRKKRYSDDEDDDDEGGISGWKLGIIVSVIVVCFAMLYPTVFHPLLMGLLGRGAPPQAVNPSRPPVHPGMGAGGPRHGGPGGMRGGAEGHPAMRMAAAQAESSGGGGKGMFTYMLPIYTVGVVVFLLYTLFKSKNKKKSKKRNRFDSSDDSSDDESTGKLRGKLGKKKLKGLQERLKQTEEAMSKILEQLEAVQASGLDVLQEKNAEPNEEPTEKKDETKVDKAVTSADSDVYINDLEKALTEFKMLSEAYEKERGKCSEDSEDSEVSEDEGDSSSASTEEEEPQPKRKSNKKPQKTIKKEKRKEVEEKKESGSEEEGIDIDAEELKTAKESVIENKPVEKQDKKVRRRAKKT